MKCTLEPVPDAAQPKSKVEKLWTLPIGNFALFALHWLIGRSLSDEFSPVIASTWQIFSGVYVGGAPDRGVSQAVPRRSSYRLPVAAACANTFGQTPSVAHARYDLGRARARLCLPGSLVIRSPWVWTSS
jgi:hypothetical protein